MSTQAPLIPSLYALLPSALHTPLAAQLSLISIHAEPFRIQDDIYTSTSPSIPGERTLRLRTQYHSTASGSRLNGSPTDPGTNGKGKGKARASVEEKYSLAYVSQALSGREYGEMNVRAVQGMDIAGLSRKEEICEFIQGLGLSHSHSYTRSGLLFYIPLPHPTMTLRLSITRIVPVLDPLSSDIDAAFDRLEGTKREDTGDPGTDKPKDTTKTRNTARTPYLVQLSPSRSVQAVPQRGEPSLTDVMRMMRDVAGRVDMLDWGTGRE